MTHAYCKLLPFLCKAQAVVEAPAASALHPLVYLPFHLVSHHLTARTFPKKHITYPANLALTVIQYLSEHYSAELPTLAQFGAVLVPVVLSLVPFYYYRCIKNTTGPKSLVWAGLALFVAALFTFKVLELLPGFPKDDPAEQAQANLDAAHSYWHLFLHVLLVVNGLLASSYVPWNPTEDAKVAVPASPTHRTRQARGTSLTWACPPSPKQQGAFKAHRPVKATKAA